MNPTGMLVDEAARAIQATNANSVAMMPTNKGAE